MSKDVLEVLRDVLSTPTGMLPDEFADLQSARDRIAELIAAAGNPDLNCTDTAAIPRRKRQQALAELAAALAACRGL